LRRELAFFRAPPTRDERVERDVARFVRLLLERAELDLLAVTRRDDFFAAELRDDFFAEVRRDAVRDDFFELDLRALDFTAMDYPPLETLLWSDEKQS
jgi:hypothetical protein